jgi:hypothetical protein
MSRPAIFRRNQTYKSVFSYHPGMDKDLTIEQLFYIIDIYQGES